MRTLHEYTVKVPDYALPFLINGDDSNLTEEDITTIDLWYAKLQKQADRYQCMIIISPDNECHPYFTATPAFGSPCDVIDCTVAFLQ